jgi:hypothetical protein
MSARRRRLAQLRGIGFALAIAVFPGTAIGEEAASARPDREELPLFITGEHWRRWGELERVLYVKGFVEAYHSQAQPYVPRPDIKTIADVDRALSAFYARHPEARKIEVNVLITTLLGSALDLDSVATLARPGAGIREEAAPAPPAPKQPPPDL